MTQQGIVPPELERRKHMRAPARAGLALRTDESPCKVLDISCAGIRYITPNPPPLMSRVDLVLQVPLRPGPDAELHEVLCEGAVVRTETYGDEVDAKEVAIFFTALEERDRIAIEAYVRAHAERPEIA